MQNRLNLRLTEDLIVALILGNSNIEKESRGLHRLVFSLPINKQIILEKYLKKNRINSLEFEKDSSGRFTLKHSLILERIISEWTKNCVVEAIDPRYFNKNMFMLWLCLFGEKTKRYVIIKHNHLSYRVQQAIIQLFKEIMSFTTITTNGYYFKISCFKELFLESIRNSRPSYESAELWDLLSNNEKEKLNLLRKEFGFKYVLLN